MMDHINEQNESIWKNKTWVRMFSAYSISIFGDYLDMMAVFALLAYTWHADPLLIAMIPISFALPGILLSSFAGVLADRWKKSHIMIGVSFASGILTILLVFVNNIYLFFPLLFLRSTVGLFQSPAEQALTRTVVHEDQLLRATSMNQLVNQASKIVGPLLGGIILAFLTAKICILVNGISFLLAGLILLTIRKLKADEDAVAKEKEEGKSFLDSWKEGWHFIFKNKVIFWTLMIGTVSSLIIQLVDSQFAVLFREIAPDNPSVMGWVIASVGFGSVIVITRLNKKKDLRYGWMFGGAGILLGIGFSGIGALNQGFNLFLALGLGIIAGIGNGIWMVTFNFVLQHESPKNMVGRVFGILNVLMSAVFIIAPLTGGIFIHFKGPDEIFQWVGWAVCALGILVIMFRNKIYPSHDIMKETVTVKQL